MANLKLGLLGLLEVTRSGTLLVQFESDKARALLAYLALESGRAHRREALVGLLWPDSAEDSARRNLRQTLYSLRQAIGDAAADPPYLIITRDQIQFNAASDYTLDVARFNALCDSAQGAVDAIRIAQLEEAVALYRGKFLKEFFLADSTEFEEWAMVQREALHQRALDALATLATYFEQRGEFSAARRHLARQLELDPWHEEAHRQLMRVLALDGQRTAALAQYETCRQVLGEQLGVEPDPKTRELYEQIRLGTLTLKTDVLTSKLFIPALRPSLVPRPRLIHLLNEGLRTQRKLTLVSAPAGFGKTTLVVAWLQQSGLPAAWLSLDEADNDLPRFLGYLAAAVHRVDEGIGASLRGVLQAPQLPAIEKILTAFLNEIALRTEPLILVLDDYHLLSQAAIFEVVEFLLLHQPPQLHLVLTTREDPDLPLARLRARDQLNEIRAKDLRFTQAETVAFLRDVMGLELSMQDVAALDDRTEGWAVGLQLAGLSLQKHDDIQSFIADFSGSHRHILDYLTDEVIQQQPEGIRTFLLQTSILDRLSGPLCDALTGRTDSGMVLAQLEAANLFVIPLDEKRCWYRYHHLFADLLRSQLTRSQPAAIAELHRRASRWYEEHGDIQAAVDHALRDPDLARAAQLVERHAIPRLYQGEVTRVLGWFDRLPEANWQSVPMLCISKAWALALMQRGKRGAEVERALHAADEALDRLNAGQDLRDLVAGHAATIQAFLLHTPALPGETPERLIALSRQAQRLLPAGEKAIRSVSALTIGHGYLALADLEAARLAYQQALDDGLAGGNLYAAIYGPINLVSCALLVGQWQPALKLCERSIAQFNQIVAGQNFPPIGGLYILKGSILQEYDRLAGAERALTEGLDLIRWTGEYEAPQKGYTELARLRAIQGDRAAMLAVVQSLADTWPEGNFYAQTLRHRLSLRHWPDDPGVIGDARLWLAQAGIEFEQRAVIQGVDPMSVATFESHLGATHVLARLAPAMSGAYPLEPVQTYLQRQGEFAQTRGIIHWVVAVAIARTLLYQAAGQKAEALATLEGALTAAAPTGLLRIFVDEGEPVRALLAELKPRLIKPALGAYANRLLDAFGSGSVKPTPSEPPETLLSAREHEVLLNLARGLTYEEIGRQLYVSLNTVQFHVKNIYSKLLVNKREQALEKARALHLI